MPIMTETRVRLRIERYADQGRCVSHLEDGRVVFVRFALPGELVEVLLDEPHGRAGRFATGEITQVLEASPDRREPVWPLAGPLAWGGGLGGADLIHVSLPGQLAWKADLIGQQMARLGGVDVQVPVARVPGDEELGGLHWRTRIELVADEQGRPSMRRRGSHDRLPIQTMPLATQELLKLAEDLGIWEGGLPAGARIRLAAPQPRDGGPIGDNYALLVNGRLRQGSRLLTERLEAGTGLEYRVQADGFWQVHRQAPVVLARAVLDQAKRALAGVAEPVIWDLYCGSGLFTLPLAALADGRARLLAVEGSAGAIASAKNNVKRAGLDRVVLRRGDVAKVLTGGPPKGLGHPDLILLDPPRAGAKAAVCRLLAASGAGTIIYVACDPTSLARDTSTLISLGYSPKHLEAFDIYPMTHHVETVAVFTRTAGRRR